MDKKKGLIIFAPPAVGKTTVAKLYDGVVDLSNSAWRNSLDGKNEKTKSACVSNPNWPYNFIPVLEKQKDLFDLTLTAIWAEFVEKPEIKKYLDSKIDYKMALPKLTALDRIFKGMKERGNKKDFIDSFKYYYPLIIKEFGSSPETITIEDDEFLEDTLLRRGVLARENRKIWEVSHEQQRTALTIDPGLQL